MKLGRSDSVSAILGEDAALLVDKGQKNGITMELAMEQAVTAPVSQGQRLGTLTVKAGEQVLRQIPLVAEAAVERLDLGELMVKVLKRAAMAKM